MPAWLAARDSICLNLMPAVYVRKEDALVIYLRKRRPKAKSLDGAPDGLAGAQKEPT